MISYQQILFAVPCTSISNNGEKGTCKFPFIYNGIEYSGCIRTESTEYWCPMELDEDEKFAKGKHKYGVCSAECPTG